IAPGISIRILYYGINYFLNYYGFFLTIEVYALFAVLWVIYIAHVFIHNKNKFNYAIMFLLLTLSILTTLISFSSLIHYAFIYSNLSIYEVITSGSLILYLAL